MAHNMEQDLEMQGGINNLEGSLQVPPPVCIPSSSSPSAGPLIPTPTLSSNIQLTQASPQPALSSSSPSSSPPPLQPQSGSMIRPRSTQVSDSDSGSGSGRSDSHSTPPPHAKRSKIEQSSSSSLVLTSSPTPSISTSRIAELLAHPEYLPMPSKRTIKALYKAALQQCSQPQKLNGNDETPTAISTTTSSESSFSSVNVDNGDQEYLKPAGLLSLEQVLLPALAIQEEQVLKQIQSKVQRDAPEYKSFLVDNRLLVRKAILRAMEAVQASRQARTQNQMERRQSQAQLREKKRQERLLAIKEKLEKQMEEKREQDRLKREQEKLERKQEKERQRQERRRLLFKQYPRNKELWKEVVFLTSSITQLEREEQMWIQAEQQLIQKQDLEQKEYDERQLQEQQGNNAADKTQNETVIVAPKHALLDKAEQILQDISLASTRIQAGLNMALKIMEEAESVRTEMYQKYRQDHQFEGYQQVHNPRSMIRFLSQDD